MAFFSTFRRWLLIALEVIICSWTVACFFDPIRAKYQPAWFKWMNITLWTAFLFIQLFLQLIRLLATILPLAEALVALAAYLLLSLLYYAYQSTSVPIYHIDLWSSFLVEILLIWLLYDLNELYAAQSRSTMTEEKIKRILVRRFSLRSAKANSDPEKSVTCDLSESSKETK